MPAFAGMTPVLDDGELGSTTGLALDAKLSLSMPRSLHTPDVIPANAGIHC